MGLVVQRGGFSIIAEYYSPGSARSVLDSVRSSPRTCAGAAAGPRGRYGFLMVSKSRLRELPGWKEWDLSASVVANLLDGSRVMMLDATRRIGNHVAFQARAQVPSGDPAASQYGMIPYAALISAAFRLNL